MILKKSIQYSLSKIIAISINLLIIYLFFGNCIIKFKLFSKKLFFSFFSNFLMFVSKNILYLM